jgi:hypothetical protein
VPLKDAHWELYLPPDYEYSHFKGSMTYERADLAPVAQDFTIAEYARQEISNSSTLEAEAMETLSRAKSELASGNYKESGNKLGWLRSRSLRDSKADKEVKQLEEQLKKVQSSNLINAQQALANENSLRLGATMTTNAFGSAQAYDAIVAEKQVVELQKAQEVAVVKRSPLRVNLPTRGLRHSFAQVLQTEVSKPLTISFNAKNDRDMGWIKKGMLWSGGFLVLWIGAGLALWLKPSRKENSLAAA